MCYISSWYSCTTGVQCHFLHFGWTYGLGMIYALGCPGSKEMLFRKRISPPFFGGPTASLRGGCWSHSRKPDFPPTLLSPFHNGLGVCFSTFSFYSFFILPPILCCWCRAMGLVGGGIFFTIVTAPLVLFVFAAWIECNLFMNFIYFFFLYFISYRCFFFFCS